MENYKLSIITVVYNAEKLLPITLNSLREVKSQEVEYIVIDGASKDNSLNILEENKDIIDQLVSEPDAGIYDAMNKGLEKASGDYVVFINAGDEIVKKAVDNILHNNLDSDIIYGDALFVKEDRSLLGLRSKFTSRTLPDTLTLDSFKMGQRVCHQSFIVKRKVAPKFDLTYKISADYDWMLDCIEKSKSSINLIEPISIFLHGGISKQLLKKALTERFWIMVKHFGWFETLWSHFKIVLRGLKFYGKNKRMD